MQGIDLLLLRRRAGLPQHKLAQLLGVPRTVICDLEHGRRQITPELENRIREAINEAIRLKENANFKVKVEYVPTPDTDRRLSRAIDILLMPATRDTAEGQESLPSAAKKHRRHMHNRRDGKD